MMGAITLSSNSYNILSICSQFFIWVVVTQNATTFKLLTMLQGGLQAGFQHYPERTLTLLSPTSIAAAHQETPPHSAILCVSL